MPIFSILIPLFNKAEHIESTLKSVLEQSFTDYEIIVVNDGSTDGSEKIIGDYSDSRIKLYNQENAGVSVARNLGIQKAAGKLIAFLDADDYWFPNHLQTLFELYQKIPDCGMYCSRYKIKTTGKKFQIPHYNGIADSFEGTIENYFYSNRPFRITWTSSLAVPKEILDKVGGFTPGVTNGQDLELWTKIGLLHRVAISNKITAIYNYDIPESLAKRNISKMKLMDFSQFKSAEDDNPALASFLDLHRFFYAILYKTYGESAIANSYYRAINKNNLSFLNRMLFHLPKALLKMLYRIKHLLKKISLEFSTYN